MTLGMWWYRYCVELSQRYYKRGEKTAAMIYWAMRDWEKPAYARLVTEEGFEELVSQYLDYKRATVPQEFDYVSKQGAMT